MADQIETGSTGAQSRGGWGLVLALILLLSVLWIVSVRRQPPVPKPESAPAAEFSGERALAVLRELVGDGSPHPIGSPANAAVRDRILARLRQAGYSPEVQQSSVCSQLYASCGQAANIVARLEGTAHDGAILLMAHYDSVPAGPGVSDDLSGVAAVLETARALKAGPAPKNPVIILLTDGEEAGLLGAKEFADSPLAREVKVVVNLEARGTRGPSLMFETIGDDGWLVPLFAAGSSRPVSSSVFVTIYHLMPNNTDLTVFKRRGVDGMNFAFVENPTHYHTAEDDLRSLEPASLQHHGDNALGTVRNLAQADLAHPPRGSAVFFDVLGGPVVRWPTAWTLPLAVLVLVLVLAVFWSARSGRTVTAGGMLLGLLAFLAVVVVTALLSVGLFMVLRGLLPAQWIAKPAPLVASFWSLSLVVAGLLLPWFGRRAGLLGLFTGVWLGWAILGLALAVAAPGVSYLFLVPGLIAGIAGLVLVRGGSATTGAVAVMLPVLIGGILWYPILLPLYDGLGLVALVPVAVLRAILVAGLAPLFLAARPLARRLVIGVALLVTVVGAGLAVTSPVHSESSPQPAVVQYLQDETGASHWIVLSSPPFPQAFRQAADFGPQPVSPFPWFPRQRAFLAPAPPLGAPAPELAVVQQTALPGGKRQLRLRLTSPRGAPRGTLYIPKEAQLESATFDGRPVEVKRGQLGAYTFLATTTLPPQGVEFDVVLGQSAPQDWYLVDESPGLPPGGDALQKARPATTVAFQDGDITLVSRKVRI
ncbi:MAG TPA: M20/M25/M40 family metallo-hydrolase [Thermoanaerobaculia bacterium]|nr:M20/M25/M40 family metallo-hydrolase [Thermoanaerobaculia bacterium]